MTILALGGIRGGVGTTSLVAALGFALQQMEQRVLLVDLQPRNLLGLHCNLELGAAQGWARADVQEHQGAWDEALLQVVGQLFLLPFGRLDDAGLISLTQRWQSHPGEWRQRLEHLHEHFDWVLLDLPQAPPGVPAALPMLPDESVQVRVLEADAACHALLSVEGAGDGHLLLNRFDPVSQLQRDLLLLWRERWQGRLLPQVVHRDEAMASALAWKSPVGYYAQDSLAAHDVRSLATWLLAQGEGRV
ncbi:MAG: cellulose biosynthesis protein BcsQ [Pseudomonas sp.]